MTVIGLVLRDEDDIGFRDLREVGYAGFDRVLREQEFGMPHRTRATEPRVDKDGEGSGRLSLIACSRYVFSRREGEEECCVAVQVLYRKRHDLEPESGLR